MHGFEEGGSLTMSNVSPLPHPPADLWQQLEVTSAASQQDFGRLLKAFRELQSPAIKQAELASVLGITQGHLSKMERGKTPATDLAKLQRWALCIGIPSQLLWFDLPCANDAPEVSTTEAQNSTIDDVD